jgi:hypothetical protein
MTLCYFQFLKQRYLEVEVNKLIDAQCVDWMAEGK